MRVAFSVLDSTLLNSSLAVHRKEAAGEFCGGGCALVAMDWSSS